MARLFAPLTPYLGDAIKQPWRMPHCVEYNLKLFWVTVVLLINKISLPPCAKFKDLHSNKILLKPKIPLFLKVKFVPRSYFRI